MSLLVKTLNENLPVRMAWSTRSVVEWMAIMRISAGTLSPTARKRPTFNEK